MFICQRNNTNVMFKNVNISLVEDGLDTCGRKASANLAMPNGRSLELAPGCSLRCEVNQTKTEVASCRTTLGNRMTLNILYFLFR